MDIVERLEAYCLGDQLYHPVICSEAAQEIRRLRALIKGVEIALARDENIDGAIRLILSEQT